jgi:hypothetical protein
MSMGETIMAKGLICIFGFSVTYSNSFSEQLERRSREIERHYREANNDFSLALIDLHGAVDAALAHDRAAVDAGFDGGLALLASCNDHLTAVGEALVRSRAELFEREGIDAADPLIARERFFAAIDEEAMYRQLATHGAALPQRLFWDPLATRMQKGGARAGLRLLERHLREMQSALRAFVGQVEGTRGLPLGELAPTLHGASYSVAAMSMGFTRFLTTALYFSMLCERATQLYEQASGASADAVALAV